MRSSRSFGEVFLESIDASASFPAALSMKISPFYLAFIPPTPAPFLGACLSLVHDSQLHYSEFLYQSRSPCSVYISIFMEACLVPFSFFSFSSYHSLFRSLDLFFKFFPPFWSVPSCCAPTSPVSIRRTGKELHESVFFLLPFSTSDSVSMSLSLHSQSFPALVIVPACDSPSVPRIFPPFQCPHSHCSSNCLLVLYLPYFLPAFSQSPPLSFILFAQMIWLSTDLPSSSHWPCQVGSNPPLPASCSFPLTRSVTIYFFPFPHFIHALCILVTFSFLCCLGVSTE